MTVTDRFRALFQKSTNEQGYSQVHSSSEDVEHEPHENTTKHSPFSWLEYSVFLLLGVAMLWAWNMYLAAAPYFARRFESDPWISANFQSSIISVGTVTNLLSMVVLAKLQASASYTKRVAASLIISIVAFALLALSTTFFRGISAGAYLAFVLVSVFCTSVATGLCQNGSFALASGFGNTAYTQAIMTGQAIAGVLPPIAQIVSVLAVPPPSSAGERKSSDMPPNGPSQEPSLAAFIYFLTAALISIVALAAFIPLVRRHRRMMESQMMESITSVEEAERANRKVIGFGPLYKKLHWLAASVFICFAVTMFFPVFTSQILSNHAGGSVPRLLQPPSFIPLAFLFWNTGDLLGRLATLVPLSFARRPIWLFIISIARLGFLPLYFLCNIGGRGATVPSDAFYLLVVQLVFGITNGWLGSSCMMGATEWVDEGEQEAAGGFMGLNLVAGLTAGSLLSFLVA